MDLFLVDGTTERIFRIVRVRMQEVLARGKKIDHKHLGGGPIVKGIEKESPQHDLDILAVA